MEKYLFTDGTNGTREVISREELKTLIEAAAEPEKAAIWVFSSNEWISCASFIKRNPTFTSRTLPAIIPVKSELQPRPSTGKRLLKKSLIFVVGAIVIILIYNFTRIKWEKLPALNITAPRPANVPLLNPDSVIQYLEENRAQKLDKITKTNLRIRNTWPDRIILQMNAQHDSSSNGSRYHNMELSIDNTTGYNLDNAVAKVTVWKNNEISMTDTFHFNNISYAIAAKRSLTNTYRGDSLSLSFQLIKAKVFNFCYTDDKKSNYGNDNDRWFFRE